MIKQQFIRNLGILSEEEMEKLQSSCVAIAGCGCIGGFSAELLARMGIGKLILADPDVFDTTNINRQCAATHQTINQQKVTALKAHLLSINPDLQIVCFPEGVNSENVHAFVSEADYVIDAIDYFCFSESLLLHRASRDRGLYVITAAALGFGTTVLTFAPDEMTLEQYAGLPEDISIESLQGQMFPPSGYTTTIPHYATPEKIHFWIENRTLPTISIGQALGPGVLVSQLVLHLLNRRQPVIVPAMFQLQFESTV
ncbi:MAG: moeW [Bacilli bacterium]|nr:moeW [Bacilli bacterium]